MVALVNADRVAERFGDIAAARLTLPPGSDRVAYKIDNEAGLELYSPPNSDGDETANEPELVSGRQILSEPTMGELSSGLLAAITSFKGLYRSVGLISVTLKGQVGGVYAVYSFKAD